MIEDGNPDEEDSIVAGWKYFPHSVDETSACIPQADLPILVSVSLVMTIGSFVPEMVSGAEILENVTGLLELQGLGAESKDLTPEAGEILLQQRVPFLFSFLRQYFPRLCARMKRFEIREAEEVHGFPHFFDLRHLGLSDCYRALRGC